MTRWLDPEAIERLAADPAALDVIAQQPEVHSVSDFSTSVR